MNAFEIAEAVSKLAGEPFDAPSFPFAFLEAFDNKEATIARLRNGSSNGSDVPGGVLQRNNIHIAVCATGETSKTLAALKASPATQKQKAKFILATDGELLEAEDLTSGEAIACEFPKIENHFGFFLPLAGITTVKQIHNNPVDIQATGRLNRLYLELLKENPDWGTAARRHDLNQFMARLIFCFFAEDTDIFNGNQLFTQTVEQMSDPRSDNTHEVIAEIFRAMDVPTRHEGKPDPRYRLAANIKSWADVFPYVNGGLFTESKGVPRFNRIARSYFFHAGRLDWRQINPDIFGSMIQAVADEEERGELGMHYTSVPNILKVLNPLFLDDLREQLEEAGDNARSLLNIRKRIARIRVFDPACGSGNFLVIAYKEMRKIEAVINERRGEADRASDIPLTNFRGIELRDFAAEVARLALIIAEYQCDVLYRGQKLALNEFLPLDGMNWITCGNALRLDWLSICPPTGDTVKFAADDLFHSPLMQAQIDFGNEGGETYVCGNPPYVGDKFQTDEQKSDLRAVSAGRQTSKAVDYVAGWFWKASDYISKSGSFAFVSTNSICQGVQVPAVWPSLFERRQEIFFAYTSFYWSNSASRNANVICVIVGVTSEAKRAKFIFSEGQRRLVKNISAYLVEGPNLIVEKHPSSISGLPDMVAGNIPRDQGNFMLSSSEVEKLCSLHPEAKGLVRKLVGSFELLNGVERYCLWITDVAAPLAYSIPEVSERLARIKIYRENGSDRGKLGIETAHRFERTIVGTHSQIVVPRVSSENRDYLPVGYMRSSTIVSDAAQAIYDAPLFIFAVISSRVHLAWISVTAGRMKSDFRYSSGVCYNSFPLVTLTEKNKTDLKRCAEDILLARETHWPATIADLYDPETMPDNLRQAHERNDEVLERIYIGRRFKNDTERLEKLFELYTRMTSSSAPKAKARKS